MTLAPPTAADLSLRPATFDDAAFVADMYTALWSDEPEDPVLTRYWWEHPGDDGKYERHIATRDGRPVGFAGQGHVPWEQMPERYSRLQAELMPEVRTGERLDALVAFAEERARADGALRATKWAREIDDLQIGVLGKRGYRDERRARFWELDLVAHKDRLLREAEASRARMRKEGIRILTLAEDRDPQRDEKLWRMSEEASQDTPRTVPWTPTPFSAFRSWLGTPSLRGDRFWIARVGDEVVGISVLGYPPVRGVVVTEWTATARSVRGRGVARALKYETVAQAIGLGVDRVRTDNDFKNEPILHLNESMGYQPRPEMIQFIKELAPI